MYNEVINFIPLIEQYTENYDFHNNKQNLAFLSKLSLEELWIAHTIERIGATARGIRMYQDSSEHGRSTSFFKIPIPSVTCLIDRYSKYSKFYEREDFIPLLCYSSQTPSNIKEGVGIIKEFMESSTAHEENLYKWPCLGKKTRYPNSEVQLVRIDDYTENHIFFHFKKEVAFKIKELQLEFGQWLSGLEELHPFHRFYEEWTADGKLYYKGYVAEYDLQDFIDWLNVDKYGCLVAYKIKAPSNAEHFLQLDF